MGGFEAVRGWNRVDGDGAFTIWGFKIWRFEICVGDRREVGCRCDITVAEQCVLLDGRQT